jgi:NaMN:DMB phosphoribosyltransferase
MYVLLMVVAILNGSATYGGPVVIDGFATETACLAFAAKYTKELPQGFEKSERGTGPTRNSVVHVACLKKETK